MTKEIRITRCIHCNAQIQFHTFKDQKRAIRRHIMEKHPEIYQDILKQEKMIIELQKQIKKKTYGDRSKRNREEIDEGEIARLRFYQVNPGVETRFVQE